MADIELYSVRKAEHCKEGRFERLHQELLEKCDTVPIHLYGKSLETRRISAVFIFNEDGKANAKSRGFSYDDTPTFQGKEAPQDVLDIKEYIEKRDGITIDYVLCHIYRGVTTRETTNGPVTRAGQDFIGLHNDKEALGSEIYSISFGATRKFNFRPFHNKKSLHESYLLEDGDEVHMHGPRKGLHEGCQRRYKHEVTPMIVADLKSYIESKGITIPKGRKTYDHLTKLIIENNIPPDRINLTFRQYNH